MSIPTSCLVVESRPLLTIAGFSVRTNNISESSKETASIGNLVDSYFKNQLYNRLSGRISQGVTYIVYTEYESDHSGDYTCVIGEEVAEDTINSDDFDILITIPSQTYSKLTTKEGPLPSIVINAWMEIWKMRPIDLHGKRSFIADFERYDHRASADPAKAVVDIFVGIKV